MELHWNLWHRLEYRVSKDKVTRHFLQDILMSAALIFWEEKSFLRIVSSLHIGILLDPSTNLYTEEKKVYKTQWILNYTNISSEKGIQTPMVTMLYMMVTKLYKNPYGNQPIQISIVTNLYINPHFNQHKSQW